MKFDRVEALAFFDRIWALPGLGKYHVDLTLGSANTPTTWYLADYPVRGDLERVLEKVVHHYDGSAGMLVAYDGDELKGGKVRATYLFKDDKHERRLLEVHCKGLILPTLTNKRESWGPAYTRSKIHRGQTKFFADAAIAATRARHTLRYTLEHGGLYVRLTRIAKKMCDHGDGTNTSLKHVRDGLADALGIDDGTRDIHWDYQQRMPREKEVPGAYIEVYARGTCPTCDQHIPKRIS